MVVLLCMCGTVFSRVTSPRPVLYAFFQEKQMVDNLSNYLLFLFKVDPACRIVWIMTD